MYGDIFKSCFEGIGLAIVQLIIAVAVVAGLASGGIVYTYIKMSQPDKPEVVRAKILASCARAKVECTIK